LHDLKLISRAILKLLFALSLPDNLQLLLQMKRLQILRSYECTRNENLKFCWRDGLLQCKFSVFAWAISLEL